MFEVIKLIGFESYQAKKKGDSRVSHYLWYYY